MKLTKFQQYLIIIAIALIGLILMKCGGGRVPGGAVVKEKGNMLSSFETVKPWDISPESGFQLTPSAEHVTQGKYSLKVEFPKGAYPSINTKKLRQNWGDYEYLAVDIYNPQSESLDFTVRLDDTSGRKANIAHKLNPGWNYVKIPRSKIAAKIDASNVRFVVLFLKSPSKRYTLFFDNLRLEKSGLISGIGKEALPPARAEARREPLPVREAVETGTKAPDKGTLRVAAAKLKDVPDNAPLISAGIPFAPGQLRDAGLLTFLDENGKEIPIAVKILARWPQDGSIRSLLVQFNYTIGNVYKYVTMMWGQPRTARDLSIVEPLWEFPEGYVVLPAEWLSVSQVTGPQVPLGQKLLPQYDQKLEKLFGTMRDKGWTGDINKDHFYSTAHVFYQLYARSGETAHFIAARKELLNYRDTQIILDGKDRGRAHKSAKPYYVYVQALADDYLLTGDPRSLEIAGYMAEYLKHFDPGKSHYRKGDSHFWTERDAGFQLLGIVTYYELTGNKEYLAAAKQYIDNLYKTQMEWPSRGGYIHNLYAHDPDEGARPDEFGGSPFMTGLLLEGIVKYHRLTGDEKAADSIFRAVEWLKNEGVASNGQAVKYTTAEKYLDSGGEPDLNLSVVHAFGYAYKIGGCKDNEYLKTALALLKKGLKDGYMGQRKHFNQSFRSSGHFFGYVADCAQEGIPLEILTEKPAAKEDRARPEGVFHYEDFEYSLGKFKAGSDTALSLDDNTTYLHGKSLKAESKFIDSGLTVGLEVDWSMEEYPYISFAYRIDEKAPVGLRVRTRFGDWICIGGTLQYKCPSKESKEAVRLINDGQWHEVQISALEKVREVLPKVDRAAAFGFATQGNARKGDRFWIDDFKIRK